MIIETGGRAWRENVRTGVTDTCPNCHNTSELDVWGMADGPFFSSWVLPKKAFVGKRVYFLVCPTCKWAQAPVTKGQFQTMRRGA